MAQQQEYVQSDYCVSCLTQYNKQRLLGQAYIEQLPFSDFKAFDLIFKQLPAHWMLHLANSSTIRYAQLFSLPTLAGVYCNRGTSGIDGSTATAMGAALIQQQPTLLITGDLSFFMTSMACGTTTLKRPPASL